MGQTIAEALREEGLHQGELQANREILIGLLRQKFGRVPRALQSQIKACNDIALLKAGVYRVAEVDSLNDFQL